MSKAKEMVTNGHADILWPRREDPNQNYSIKDGDLDPLFSFMEYAPLELPWRFALVEDPNKLSDAYLNKLLKTLEEPAPKTTVIFLDHNQTQFLDTIHSRATELQLIDNSETPGWKEMPKGINTSEWLEKRVPFYPNLLGQKEVFQLVNKFFDSGEGLSELVEKLRYSKGVDEELAGLVVEFESDRPGRFSQKQKLCEELAWFNESKTFNNGAWERILGLLCVVDS